MMAADRNGRPIRTGLPLSPRERQIIDLVGQGLSNKEIGDALGLATQTIKAHLASISAKLALKGRVRIALFAVETRAR